MFLTNHFKADGDGDLVNVSASEDDVSRHPNTADLSNLGDVPPDRKLFAARLAGPQDQLRLWRKLCDSK